MPFYTYLCEECDLGCELRRPIDLRDAPLECLGCGGAMTRRFEACQLKFDFLREAGFFDTTASDYNPSEEERPDLYADRVWAMSGAKR